MTRPTDDNITNMDRKLASEFLSCCYTTFFFLLYHYLCKHVDLKVLNSLKLVFQGRTGNSCKRAVKKHKHHSSVSVITLVC